MDLNKEFNLFATKGRGINTLTLERYKKHQGIIQPNAYVNPTIIEERSLNVAQMDVFSRLMMERIIFLGTAIDDDVANIIQAQLLFLDQNEMEDKDVNIFINSPGGSVQAGLGIYDIMQYISSDISTTCTGLAASMASVLLCAGTHKKRSALKHSRVMIHQPMGGMYGQAADMAIQFEEMMKFKHELYEIIADNSGQPIEKVEKDCDRDHWMTAKEALEYGMIDEIVLKRKRTDDLQEL
ncbi:MAG: ATP-dependent Clp protease proteolytic subunit [Bacteroidales bacterium]|nr:ATP-dependent Clp protease proteolytic subunit [Bacteroidales bacterium]